MSRHPLVSVVMPFLDPPVSFFREAVQSVLQQTLEDWELLLVNDGSGQEATSVAEEYTRGHPARVRLLADPESKNRGLSAARNLGLEHARGRYVAFLDSDDTWLPERLATHLALLSDHPRAGMVFGPTLYWWSWNGAPSGDPGPTDHVPPLGVPPYRLLPPPGILPLFLTGRAASPCTCAITIRRDRAMEVGGFEERFRGLYEDQGFISKMALSTPMVATDQVVDRYRQDSRSMTGKADADQERQARRAFLEWLRGYAQPGHFRLPDPHLRDLQRIIALELWVLDHPLGGRVLRTLRRIRMKFAPRRPRFLPDRGFAMPGADR